MNERKAGDRIIAMNRNSQKISTQHEVIQDFEKYFRTGVSDDYILMRGDFPMKDMSPSDFSKLLKRMFQKNNEARHGK